VAAAVAVCAAALVCAPASALGGRSSTAALQVALKARGLYGGDIDGLRGPGTTSALMAFQRRAGLAADGVAGPRTRGALGRRGRPALGRRVLRAGKAGWDVAALQFELSRHGFPCNTIDGGFGARTDAALRRFQAWAGLTADGIAGPATFAALRRPVPRSPVRLARPVAAPVGDRFGFRGSRLHAGLDFPAPSGARVASAGTGTVASVGYDGGWGRYVIVAHAAGVRTLYAHLSSVTVGRGTRVSAGYRVGSVGATGAATGPHLHFEVTVRGANVDPLGAIG
jgi:murein DD-endopeptidase MepM/ murein hydrolase activator NlpD